MKKYQLRVKMKKLNVLIPFMVIGVLFWGCIEDSPIGVDQHNLDEPDSNPIITASNYTDGTDFSEGYYNGKIRSDQVKLEWAASADTNFLTYKIFRALGVNFPSSDDFNEGFESGSLPNGWTENGDDGGWYVTDEDAASGSYSIRTYPAMNGPNSNLYSNNYSFVVDDDSNIFISFMFQGDDGYLQFYINGILQQSYNTFNDQEWAKVEILFESDPVNSLQLSWIYNANSAGGYCMLDDINISNIESDDIQYFLIETLNNKNSTTFTDTALTQNQYYTYKVANLIKTGTHRVDDYVIKTPLWQVPSNIEYEILSPEVVEVIWDDNSESESSFKINVDTLDVYFWNYETINTFSADKDDTSMVISNLSTDTQYRLGIKAYNTWEETDTSYSGSFQINFDPPTNLNASAVSDTEAVNVTWNDNTNLENGFKIQRKIDFDGIYKTIGYSGENENYYTDYINSEDFKFDTSFVYQVCAYNTYSDTVFTDYSSDDSYMFTFTFSLSPSNLIANQQSGSKLVNLAWYDNSTLEDGFKIEWDTGTGFELLATVNANANSYTDTDTTGFKYDSTYTYRSRAYNDYSDVVYTDYSNEASVTLSELSGLFEGFEGGTLPENWTESTSGGSGWGVSEDEVYNGNFSIHAGGGFSDIEYLEFTIDVPEYTTIDISFYQYENNASGDGDLYINNSYWLDWDSGSGWSQKSISYYTDSNNQITLQWRYSTYNYGDVYLDNIQISW